MASTGAEILVDCLLDWGVDTVFGLPGDGINGIMEALRKAKDKIRFIQVRHEESAAFMACGHAKYTGRLGVCLATSGPGGIHLLNGLYDAKMDGQPVLAITGHHFHDLIDTHSQQDVDLDRVFQDVAVYSTRIMGPDHVENVTHLACRKALCQRGVAHLNFPVDFQELQATRRTRSMRNIQHHVSAARAARTLLPASHDLHEAAAVLNAGKKIVLFVGAGALHATKEVLELAEKLGAPIVKALLGKAVVPDRSVYTTGGAGLLGTAASQEALEHCDTLFMIGTSFPYMEFLPQPGQARGVQLDLNPSRIGLRYPVEVGLVGDAQSTLAELLPLLKRNEDRGFLETAQNNMARWDQLMYERAGSNEKPMKPQVIAHELGKRLSDTAIVSSDSGTITTWWARHIQSRTGQMHSCSGTLATMGCGLPYTIAAQLAFPGRQCVGFVGDGGFTMLMGEFVTCVKYNLPVKIFVIRNDTLGQIKWEQMVLNGNPEYGCELQRIDFVKFAEACGGRGMRIEDPAKCGSQLDEALAHPGPMVIEAVVDQFEPPLPGKIKPGYAYKFAKALARGQPNRIRIALTATGEKIREMI